MELYLLIVLLLFVLAISDLIVGVSNDAVNFLNSAVGSKVASRRTIMIVASLGIVLGATFASGMMEVARKGIFNPQYFAFSEVMIIFLAVMLTDIILLDLFNTFALPTSTTVSIVFELLGAAVAMAAIKVLSNGEGLSAISTYINSSSALAIITGIFLSVGIAFTVGAFIQYLTRVLFTFNYRRNLQWVGVIWSGLALAAISYFLLIKGLKGASFVPAGFLAWTAEHTWLLLAIAFVIMTGIAFFLHSIRVNILRIVVLAGTFALAMAFAGNDLVNFIGVPLAGFESYNSWTASGSAPDELMMTSLAQKYPAKTYLLLGAGLVMVLTLWFSRKARSVTETEVNLGRQSEGLERFGSNALSRGVVRFFTIMINYFSRRIPKRTLYRLEKRFQPSASPATENAEERPSAEIPAFDLVRASVNLTVASVLIAIATSMKLPLSTTYVSFMVAMGTSLSDRAWGRDSAVYRVAGVLNVIGGWFMTAFIAFTLAGTFAYLIHSFGVAAIALLTAAAVLLIYHTFRLHRKREAHQERRLSANHNGRRVPASVVIRNTAESVVKGLEAIRKGYAAAIKGLLKEDRQQLKKAKKAMVRLAESNEEFKYIFYGSIQNITEDVAEGSRAYLLAYDHQQDIIQSVSFIVDQAQQHVEDMLSPLKPKQARKLKRVSKATQDYLERCAAMIQSADYTQFDELMAEKKPIYTQIETLLAEQSNGIQKKTYGARNSILYFSLLLETKDLIAVAARFVKLYYLLEKRVTREEPWGLVAEVS